MRTEEVLKNLPEKHLKYLTNLKAANKRAEAENQAIMYEQTRSTARGYIKALVDCGVISDFKPLWCWFTV